LRPAGRQAGLIRSGPKPVGGLFTNAKSHEAKRKSKTETHIATGRREFRLAFLNGINSSGFIVYFLKCCAFLTSWSSPLPLPQFCRDAVIFQPARLMKG